MLISNSIESVMHTGQYGNAVMVIHTDLFFYRIIVIHTELFLCRCNASWFGNCL